MAPPIGRQARGQLLQRWAANWERRVGGRVFENFLLSGLGRWGRPWSSFITARARSPRSQQKTHTHPRHATARLLPPCYFFFSQAFPASRARILGCQGPRRRGPIGPNIAACSFRQFTKTPTGQKQTKKTSIPNKVDCALGQLAGSATAGQQAPGSPAPAYRRSPGRSRQGGPANVLPLDSAAAGPWLLLRLRSR